MTNWPTADYASLVKYYGKLGSNTTSLILPYPMKLAWDTSIVVKRITCHEKIHDALFDIFDKTLSEYGLDKIKTLRLDLFGGCVNVRKMRGSSTKWSIHSWGAAVDIDPDKNRLKWGKDRASLAKEIYEPFWKIVESAGCYSLGRRNNYDWMHFQFTKNR